MDCLAESVGGNENGDNDIHEYDFDNNGNGIYENYFDNNGDDIYEDDFDNNGDDIYEDYFDNKGKNYDDNKSNGMNNMILFYYYIICTIKIFFNKMFIYVCLRISYMFTKMCTHQKTMLLID